MKTANVLLLATAALFSFVSADTISCNLTSSCPEDSPCCSQYGECGTGINCLGGCDPRYSYNLTACMPQPRMSSFTEAFDSTDALISQDNYLGNSSETEWVYTGYVATNDNALLLQMPNGSTGTVISSTKYFWFGKVGATMKSSHDRGVITAFITFSDVQDEIDFEFLGYNLTNPQTNYYSIGILNYTNTENSTVTDTFENWHYYEVDWQEDKIDWLIDGEVIRTLEKADTWNSTTDRYDFPATPSRVQFSLWPGGSSLNGIGTIEWAGGEIDWDSLDIEDYGYYYAYLKNVSIECYDLPSTVGIVNESDYTAFLYNNTDGYEDAVYLTNEKTWLGSTSASGLDPQNDDDDSDDSSSSSSSSGLKLSTKSSSTTGTAKTTSKSLTGTTTGTTSTYGGGFVQDSGATSSSSSTSSGSSSSSAATTYGHHYLASAMIAAFAVAGGMFFIGF